MENQIIVYMENQILHLMITLLIEIYTYYKNKLSHREADNSLETFLGIEGAIKKQ